MSEKPTVVEALSAVMGDVRAVAKGDRNSDQGYIFRGVDAVVNAVGPILRKHNVIVMPMCQSATYRDVQTSRGKPSRECTVMVRYRFYGPAGDFIEAETPGESMDFGDKGAPKAMSVAYRIALIQGLCLPTHDNDPDEQAYERSTPPRREPEPEPDGPAVATAALKALAAKCEKMGYDRDRVAAVYATRYEGADVRKETDTQRVLAFIKLLDGLPEHELKPAAANGAKA